MLLCFCAFSRDHAIQLPELTPDPLIIRPAPDSSCKRVRHAIRGLLERRCKLPDLVPARAWGLLTRYALGRLDGAVLTLADPDLSYSSRHRRMPGTVSAGKNRHHVRPRDHSTRLDSSNGRSRPSIPRWSRKSRRLSTPIEQGTGEVVRCLAGFANKVRRSRA
jgi:hypothetical protein